MTNISPAYRLPNITPASRWLIVLNSSPLIPQPSDPTESYGMVPGPNGWNPGATTTPYFMPEETNTFIDLSEQDWWDPLGALDFCNFAQAGSADSTTGFGFY